VAKIIDPDPTSDLVGLILTRDEAHALISNYGHSSESTVIKDFANASRPYPGTKLPADEDWSLKLFQDLKHLIYRKDT